MTPTHYLCPHCRAHLRPNKKIILGAKAPDGNKGLILLSPELGEYSVLKHGTLDIKEGDIMEIFCPVCSSSLDYSKGKKLANVVMIEDNGIEYDIIFSKIYGKKCTYKIQGEQVESFGEDAEEYTNFWGEAPKY